MSNSASISAAKKRRGGAPPPMPSGGGPNMNLPPGLPPNFRQLPPQVQQQLFQQMQQRANAAAALKVAPQVAPTPPTPLNQPPPRNGGNGGNNNTVNVPGPYTVNSVIHNRAMAEVDGIHIRDLPISSAGLPCLPSGAALPPNVLFKLHHDELLNMDAILNEHSNKIQMLSNKFDRGETVTKVSNDGQSPAPAPAQGSGSTPLPYDNLVNNTDFITKILDNILTNTNLSDIINQIEPLQKENESLRALLHSQQMTLNELSALVMKLVSTGLVPHSSNGSGSGGDHHGNDTNHDNQENEENEGDQENDGEHGNDQYENDDHNNVPNMEYSVYIPEETGDAANNGEHVEGYGEEGNGTSWDS
jgi:hypothetical protein